MIHQTYVVVYTAVLLYIDYISINVTLTMENVIIIVTTLLNDSFL